MSAISGQSVHDDPRLGSRLGKYRLTRVIGRGGMGVVYEAEDTVLKRRVAIKLLSNESGAESESLRRLLHEAQAAEKKDPSAALKYYREILGLYNEYRVPYLWIQEIREKVANLEKRLK